MREMPETGRLRRIEPRVWALGATALVCLLILFTGVYLQSQVHVNHDVAWITHSAAWLLDGKRFGTDILDVNPPLAWFLMMPAAAVARAGWLPEIVAIQAWNWLLTIAALALSAVVLPPMGRAIGHAKVLALLVVSVAVAAILPIGNFGQRDVLALILILPYLYSMIGRTAGVPASGRLLPVIVGFAAGFGFCLKPFLLALPVLLELLQLLLSRSFRALFRAETIAMAVTVLSYAGAILLFARDYLDFALPLIRAVYWAYDDSGYRILDRFRDAAMPAAYALGVALLTFSFTRVHAMFVAAVAAFAASYWVQGKGFPYHAYPLLGAGCLFLTYSIIHGIGAIRSSTRIARNDIRWVLVAVLLLVTLPVLRVPFSQSYAWYQTANRTKGDWGRMRQEVIDRLRALGAGPSDFLYALSTHPNPGFPTVNYLGTQWAGREVAQFVIPAHVRRKEVTVPAVLGEIDRATKLQVRHVIEAIERHHPRFVMVEARQRRLGLSLRRFDDLAFYGRDPQFERLWACYEELEPAGQIRLFRRLSVCP